MTTANLPDLAYIRSLETELEALRRDATAHMLTVATASALEVGYAVGLTATAFVRAGKNSADTR